MTPTLLALSALLFAADPTPVRQPHPLAPSLNQLSDEEEQKIDDIINRFMKADTGQIKGEEAKKAQRDFEALGPDAIPALLRGLNRAAQLDHSCPTLMIAKKLSGLLKSSDDAKLLEFARDEIASPRNKHAGVLAELRTMLVQRRNAVARANPGTITGKTQPTLSTADLVTAARREGGTDLRKMLVELEKRNGREVLPGFSSILKNNDIDTQQYVRELMDNHLGRQPLSVLRQRLKEKDNDIEIRRCTLRVAARLPEFIPHLIEALGEDQAEVREDAHKGLLKWSKNKDFGPTADADQQQRQEAQAKWREWLSKRQGS